LTRNGLGDDAERQAIDALYCDAGQVVEAAVPRIRIRAHAEGDARACMWNPVHERQKALPQLGNTRLALRVEVLAHTHHRERIDLADLGLHLQDLLQMIEQLRVDPAAEQKRRVARMRAERTGCDAEHALERARERFLRVVSRVERELDELRRVPGEEALGGARQAPAADVRTERLAGEHAEQSREVVGREPSLRCRVGERDRLAEVSLDAIDAAQEPLANVHDPRLVERARQLLIALAPRLRSRARLPRAAR
jgi:hypothetical protein